MSVGSAEPVSYGLGRTFSASVRLNLQHYLWKDVLGYNIHPNIPLHDENDFRIADIGTGTGIWLIDVSRQLSAACLEGFDISTNQFPPKTDLPANVSLKSLDVFSPIPEEFIGKYDVVHVRLFICVIKEGDPRPVLSNISKMLKPGGCIQWSDHNLNNMTILKPNTELKSTAMGHIAAFGRAAVDSSWVSCLSEIYEELGFKNVSANDNPIKPELRAFFTHLQFMVCEEFSYTSCDNSCFEADGPNLRRLIAEASQESLEGVTFDFLIKVATGTMP